MKTISESKMKNLFGMGIALFSLGLGGCMDMRSPTTISENSVQVREEAMFEDVAIYNVNDEYLRAVARHYERYSGSVMDVIVTYDPRSYRNTAMKANDKLAGISQKLKKFGVLQMETGVLPVKGQGDDARLIVSYNAYSAHAPKGCDSMMPGMNGSELGDDKNYKLGCTSQTLLARQVSRPKDLLGRGSVDQDTDGRAASNIVGLYRTGAQNASLDGESATGE